MTSPLAQDTHQLKRCLEGSNLAFGIAFMAFQTIPKDQLLPSRHCVGGRLGQVNSASG
jgi:hypothetical protein